MTRKSNINDTLAQATGGVMLATAADDLGIVPAHKAAAEAAQAARQAGEEVTLRDATTDALIAIIAPDGSTAAAQRMRSKAKPNKRKLTELFVRKVKPRATAFIVWDTLQRGLVLRVQPSGRRSWNVIYNRHGRTRWLHLGDANAIGLADARQLAAEAMLAVARGGDPAAEKRAERGAGTFGELHEKYVEQWAKKHNKSWKQAAALVSRYALPRWGKLQAASITRGDVKALMSSIAAPVLANQVLAAVSAIYTWAVKDELAVANPCKLIDRNPTVSRERVLSASEIPKFWAAFNDADPVIGSALKSILLLGQRPGEVAHMRREHLRDGWWELPGEPMPSLHWPGTKNAQSHRVWLPAAVQALIAEQGDDVTGFVFAGPRGRPVRGLDQAMREVCAKLKVERATPHDLRRTFSTTVTSLGFGRDALNRVTNHHEGGIASVYDRHGYADENKRVTEATAAKLLSLAGGRAGRQCSKLRTLINLDQTNR
jgi:integrase